MSSSVRQGDLFPDDRQGSLFEEPAPKPWVFEPDIPKIRGELYAVLDELRRADEMPWDGAKLLYWKTVVPQMSKWLGEEERAQLCFDFEQEIRRLAA